MLFSCSRSEIRPPVSSKPRLFLDSMTTAIFFPGYRQRVGDLEHAPLKLLASIPEIGLPVHFYRGSLNRDIYHAGMQHCCIGNSLSRTGFMADYLIKSYSYLRKHSVSLIYCFDVEMAFFLRCAARHYQIPIVLQVGVDWAAYRKRIKRFWKRRILDGMTKSVLKDVSAVVTLAHHLKAPIEAWKRSPTVLYPFIDMTAYPFAPAKRSASMQMLFIGRLAPVKGGRYLIDCLPRVLGERKDFHLNIVGGSDPGRLSDESYIRSRIQSCGLSGHVSLVGQVEHSRVVDYLKNADLLIIPSETEGFNYAMLEAWASGVPVLATDIPNHRELVDDSVGRICGFSPESMAGGILEFLCMEGGELLQMKHAARRKAEEMTTRSRQAWRDFFRGQTRKQNTEDTAGLSSVDGEDK